MFVCLLCTQLCQVRFAVFGIGSLIQGRLLTEVLYTISQTVPNKNRFSKATQTNSVADEDHLSSSLLPLSLLTLRRVLKKYIYIHACWEKTSYLYTAWVVICTLPAWAQLLKFKRTLSIALNSQHMVYHSNFYLCVAALLCLWFFSSEQSQVVFFYTKRGPVVDYEANWIMTRKFDR